ncbi:MAG: hypothetical protein AAGF33_09630 [Pseudomonadota bacterium]
MIYRLARFRAALVGYDRVIAQLSSSGNFALAWEIATAQQLRRLNRDPTWSYSINFAEEEVERAQLALSAKAYEWAWVNASDAIAIFEWKGQQDCNDAQQAMQIVSEAENFIDPARIEDLTSQHQKTKKQHNNLGELRFKQRVASSEPGVWKVPTWSRTRISSRPY